MVSPAASTRQRAATTSGRWPSSSLGNTPGTAGAAACSTPGLLIARPRSGPLPSNAASALRAASICCCAACDCWRALATVVSALRNCNWLSMPALTRCCARSVRCEARAISASAVSCAACAWANTMYVRAMLVASIRRAACASTSLARAWSSAARHVAAWPPQMSGLHLKLRPSRTMPWYSPPRSSGATVEGISRPAYCALAPSVGLRAASARPACAIAWRTRASAAASDGVPVKASSINASSCGSPSDFHQSCVGNCASEVAPTERWISSALASRGCDSGARPRELAQPARATARASAATVGNAWRMSASVRKVVADLQEQAAEFVLLRVVQARGGLRMHALRALVDVLPDRLALGREVDVQRATVAGVGDAGEDPEGFQLVEQARHRAGVQVGRAGEFADAGGAVGQVLDRDELAEVEVVAGGRELAFHAGPHGVPDLPKQEAEAGTVAG